MEKVINIYLALVHLFLSYRFFFFKNIKKKTLKLEITVWNLWKGILSLCCCCFIHLWFSVFCKNLRRLWLYGDLQFSTLWVT